MKLSVRTRYGVRAMFELAAHYGEGPVQTRRIAGRQNISLKYLEQLMSILKSAGLIRSIRGSKGGYLLSKSPNQIRLREVFEALEGPVTTAECIADESYCARVADCAARRVWGRLERTIRNVLESITLQDMVQEAQTENNLDYQI